MKKLLASAAMIAAVAMIAAPATAQVTGYVGGQLGQLKFDNGAEQELDLLGVEGAVAFPVGTGFVAQVNASLTKLDAGTVDVEASTISGNFGVRNAQWAAAAYAGVKESVEIGSGWVAGGEFLYFLPQITLAGGAGFGKFDDVIDLDALGASGEVRYFFNDNLRVDGRVAYNSLETGGADIDGLGGGASAEWKPDNFPVSVFGNVDFAPVDAGGGDIDITTLSIGVRFDFGNGTLKARDRSGAAFKPAAGFGGAFNAVF